ncbi:MAG: beta-N-acetylhexosaminidase [Myxococcales bacterium]|jgi:beta-N-acetylhexosaminidase|nr:beta-N-acetylhexosaminidase [Myxococcales bacterium]
MTIASDYTELAASLFCIGFEHDPLLDPNAEAIPDATRELIRLGVSGAILFKRNIRSPAQLARLTATLKNTANRPFLLAVDQEGGRVARLRGAPFTDLPPMRKIGEENDESLAFRCGQALAADLRGVGFDVDFAPVLDVDTNPLNPVIADRSFGSAPERVARLGIALARGLEEGGVASCAKHFPGHGDTSQDSHLDLPRLPHTMARLRSVELVPFAAYARAGLASMMSAHVVFEAVDPDLPATFSSKIQTDLLRGELGFDGLCICDDLEMRAIADRWPIPEAAVHAVRAGIDLLLVCHRPEAQLACIEALVREGERSSSFRARLREASHRVRNFAQRWFRPFTADDFEAPELFSADPLPELCDAASMGLDPDPTDFLNPSKHRVDT